LVNSEEYDGALGLPSSRLARLKTLTGQPAHPAEGDVYYNVVMDRFFIYTERRWDDLLHPAPQELKKVKDLYRLKTLGLDAAMEAVELSHERGKDGKCKRGCPGCVVRDMFESLLVANRIME
jgi:hypothetical protein